MLAHGAPDQERTRTFARYSLIGALSMAAGSLAAAAPDFMAFAGIGRLSAFKIMFYAYAVLGLLSAALYRRLPHARMDEARPECAARTVARGRLQTGRAVQSRCLRRRLRRPVAAGAVAVSSVSTCRSRPPACSFSGQATLSAFSYPVAAWLAKRIGLVNTMVFTHIPSSIFLILAAFSPNLILTLGLLLVRSALSQMDVPTRTSYVMAVVTPAERTAAASVTAVPRSLASSISPAMAGVLLATSFSGLPLVICGVLKIAYDVALLFSFRHVKPPEEKTREAIPAK